MTEKLDKKKLLDKVIAVFAIFVCGLGVVFIAGGSEFVGACLTIMGLLMPIEVF